MEALTTESSQKSEKWILVTTSRSLLLLNPRNGAGYRLDSGRGAYYGVCRLGEDILIGARNRLAVSPFPVRESKGEILVFDREFRYVHSLIPSFPLRDIHQILSAIGTVWVTCSFDDMVAIYDGSHWDRWYPKGEPESGLKDRYHFNSLSHIDDRIYLVANRHGPSEVLAFDSARTHLCETFALGQKSHNLWKEGSRWMTCSSGESKIVGSDGFSVDTGGFPRGVAFLGKTVCIGISANAERALRDFSTGHIQVYGQEWKLLKTIQLTREGIVTDLFAIDVNPIPELTFRERVAFESK